MQQFCISLLEVMIKFIFQGDVIHDLVVSADPDSPPLSLLVLYKVASEMFKVFATSYVHSSVVGMPQNLREVFQNGGCTNRDENEVAFTLLWKKSKYLLFKLICCILAVLVK